MLTFVAMDAQYGVSLTVNGRASYTVAIGPNIALDLQISPSRGAVLVNNYLVESQQRTQVSTINAIRNGVNKLTLMNKAAKIAAVAPITANAINQVNTLNNVFGSLRRRRSVNRISGTKKVFFAIVLFSKTMTGD